MRQLNRSEVAICTSKDMARRLLEYIENSERDGNTRPPDLPLEKLVCRSGSKLGLDMEQQTGSKLEKEYVKAVYCHPAYLYAEYIM